MQSPIIHSFLRCTLSRMRVNGLALCVILICVTWPPPGVIALPTCDKFTACFSHLGSDAGAAQEERSFCGCSAARALAFADAAGWRAASVPSCSSNSMHAKRKASCCAACETGVCAGSQSNTLGKKQRSIVTRGEITQMLPGNMGYFKDNVGIEPATI